MSYEELERLDALHASLMALENFVHAALVTLCAEQESPQQMAEKIGKRAKRDAESIRRSAGSAVIVLPMEDRVADMARNLIIAVSGLSGKPARRG